MWGLLLNRYTLAAIGAVACVAALYGYGAYQHSQGYDQAQNEQHVAALEAFKTESERLQGLSLTLETQLVLLREAQPKIIERYNRVVVEKPLPVGCIIDPDRLRELNELIKTANSAQSAYSLPSRP